ncbi:MAG: 5'/3'-nucleotidase SurE [Gammaproteobacteria bacterium]|nr:5'/3'-nucleotidase SurE [Gammaproteobacteria bacterium]
MKLLLSNDDGVHAIGLQTLTQYCQQAGWDVQVIAPDRDRSGASNSLTLSRPLTPIYLANGHISIDGTPTDCVHLGIHTLCPYPPERVIAGINAGPNLGDDVIYSGTVAAAMEGRFLDLPPIAISLAGKVHYETAAQVLIDLLPKIHKLNLPARTLLNINVPDVPFAEITGIEITRLGHRAMSDMPVLAKNPRGKECYWISPQGKGADAGPGTDFYAISQNKVSITPIQVDMTGHDSLDMLKEQLL